MAIYSAHIVFITILLNCYFTTFVFSAGPRAVRLINEGKQNNTHQNSEDSAHQLHLQTNLNTSDVDVGLNQLNKTLPLAQQTHANSANHSTNQSLEDARLNTTAAQTTDAKVLFYQKPRSKNLDSFIKIEELFNSTNLVLERINERLAGLEEANRKQNIKIVELESKSYLESLNPPVKGSSFNGSTTESIAEAIAGDLALAVEILNYLDVNLKDYQLHLPRGLEHQKAKLIVEPKTSEIFTFTYKKGHNYPEGVFSYRIGDSGFSLHLYFFSGGRYAFGLLGNEASVETLWSIEDYRKTCSAYTHNGSPNSFRCIDDDSSNWDTTMTFLINQDSVYAKLTIIYKYKTSILKVQIFKFYP